MLRRVISATVVVTLLAVLAVSASFAVVPHSIRIHLASIATCDIPDEQVRELSLDSKFEESKWWERLLAYGYRLKYWFAGGPTKISDYVGGDMTVFHGFLTTSDSLGGLCDAEILALQDRFLASDRSIDEYDSLGLTALQQAIIFQNIAFVKRLIDEGADGSKIVNLDNELIRGKTAIELANWFVIKKKSDTSKTIADLLHNET